MYLSSPAALNTASVEWTDLMGLMKVELRGERLIKQRVEAVLTGFVK